jgi:hypothetical protein
VGGSLEPAGTAAQPPGEPAASAADPAPDSILAAPDSSPAAPDGVLSAPDGGTAATGAPEPTARGFPGFPVGDPRQLPLSQRPRGLDARPVPGGGDPELPATIARERPYVRLLVAMVAVIVGGSLILTFLAIASAMIYR